ncbi:MAG: GtrA family protein [Clostridiales bacterium]|nr:GtrA family protein [Clostridiales bacterium]
MSLHINTDAFKLDRLKKRITPEVIRQGIKYLITGFSSFGFEFFLLFAFKDLLNLTVVLSNSLALGIVFWFNFLMNRFWSFKSKGDIKKQVLMYGCLFFINLGLSDLVMYLMTAQLGIHYLIAKIFATGMIVVWNFIIYRKVIYK